MQTKCHSKKKPAHLTSTNQALREEGARLAGRGRTGGGSTRAVKHGLLRIGFALEALRELHELGGLPLGHLVKLVGSVSGGFGGADAEAPSQYRGGLGCHVGTHLCEQRFGLGFVGLEMGNARLVSRLDLLGHGGDVPAYLSIKPGQAPGNVELTVIKGCGRVHRSALPRLRGCGRLGGGLQFLPPSWGPTGKQRLAGYPALRDSLDSRAVVSLAGPLGSRKMAGRLPLSNSLAADAKTRSEGAKTHRVDGLGDRIGAHANKSNRLLEFGKN